jgi:hypothetical protein
VGRECCRSSNHLRTERGRANSELETVRLSHGGSASSAGKNFHDHINQQEFVAIYNQADAKLRAAVKQDDLNKLIAQVHKLGNVTAATRPGTIGLAKIRRRPPPQLPHQIRS